MSSSNGAFRTVRFRRLALALAFVPVAACESPLGGEGSADAGQGTGNDPSTYGGAASSGGSSAGNGGAPAAAGSTGNGGALAAGTGGVPGTSTTGTGGVSETGGSVGTGGGPEAGGSTGTGGAHGTGGRPSGFVHPECADPNAPATCGNGRIEPGEQCDGANVGGIACRDIDPIFDSGALGCTDSCKWDLALCVTNETCGNGVVDATEDCEPRPFNDLGYQFCRDYLPGGNDALVACNIITCKYDFRNCSIPTTPPVCGNGILEGGEQCDGKERIFRTCIEYPQEYTWGALGCNPTTCQFDLSQCERCDGSRCGDGIIQPSYEECDGPPTRTCADVLRLFGTVTCSPRCTNDTSKCTGGCNPTPYGWICS